MEEKNTTKEEEELKIDHDTYWKKAITELFENLVAYKFPALHKKIDWKVKPQFLEQEFHELISTRYKGKHIVDKLAKVTLLDGTIDYILFHVEAQSTGEKDTKQRMFDYYYHIYYKKSEQTKITALAIYTGKNVPKNPHIYKREFAGTTLSYQFNTIVVRDLKEEDLIASNNPIALILLAAKYEHQSKKQSKKRFSFKKKLINLLAEKDYSREQIRMIFEFIVFVVKLPKPLELKFNKHIVQQTTKSDMKREGAWVHKQLVNDLYKAVYGESPNEKVRKMEEAMKETNKLAEKDRKEKEAAIAALVIKEEEQRMKDEEQRKRIEEQRKRIEEQRKKAEEERKEKEEIQILAATSFITMGKSLQEIVNKTKLTEEKVIELAENLGKTIK